MKQFNPTIQSGRLTINFKGEAKGSPGITLLGGLEQKQNGKDPSERSTQFWLNC